MTQSNISKFKRFLNKSGAILLDPTNEWEVVRFKTDDETISVMYGNSKGRPPKFTGYAREAYNAFVGNYTWKAVNRTRQQLTKRKASLAARDGRRCFACLKSFELDKLTIEHILSFSHGGTDNENNLCLLDKEHNELLGNLPITEKIEIIIKLRETYTHVDKPVENIWDWRHTKMNLIFLAVMLTLWLVWWLLT